MSDNRTDFSIHLAGWDQDGERRDLVRVRRSVFIIEQCVPSELEWDGYDQNAIHLVARAPDGAAVGTARMLPDGHIGRMAVLRECRGRGIGTALLQTMLREARKQGLTEVWLDAQTHAIPFYERFGFIAEGPEFPDAGIPHRRMHCMLNTR